VVALVTVMKTMLLAVVMVMAGCASQPKRVSSAPLADPNEERCMLVAERAYEAAACHEMSSLGDAPVPDAAYEDAYASCTEAR
jgi:hypothetical protein